MRIGEAILLGALEIEKIAPCDPKYCAVGMILHAHGIKPIGRKLQESIDKWIKTPLAIHDVPDDYDAVLQFYPWLRDLEILCPLCQIQMEGCEIIFHLFDEHVMINFKSDGTLIPHNSWNPFPTLTVMPLEDLAEFMNSLEPNQRLNQEPVIQETELIKNSVEF